jgi:hypothetical protein
MTPTDTPHPQLTRSGGADFAGPLLAAASYAAETSAQAYLDGLDRAVGLQRQLVGGTPLEAVTELFAAHAGVTRRLVEEYAGAARQVPATAAEATRTADATTARAVSGTAEAATRGTRRTGRAAAKATKRGRATAAKATQRTAAATAKATRSAAAATPAKPARTTAAKPAGPARPAAARTTAPAGRSAASGPEAPITGYDELTAEQLIAKLPELSQSELVAVQRYERAHDSRSTVLGRVEELQGAEPAPGYDQLNADDVQKLVAGGPPELATRVRDYERRHKSRATVLQAVESTLDAS